MDSNTNNSSNSNTNNSSSVVFEGGDNDVSLHEEDDDYDDYDEDDGDDVDEEKFKKTVAFRSSANAINTLRIHLLKSCIEIIADGLPLNEVLKKQFIASVSKTLADMNILPAEIDNPIIKSATMQVKSSIEAVLMDTLKRITIEGDSTGLAVMKLEDNFSNSLNFEKYSSYYDLLDSNYKKDFEEIARVGKGAFGSVYKVKKYSDNNIYAVKVIKLKGSKEDLKTFSREVQQLGRLSHSNVVRYYNSWSELVNPVHSREGMKHGNKKKDNLALVQQRYHNITSATSNVQLYIQMEFCPSTLEKWLDVRNEKESFKDEDNRTIMEQILRGIQHLHCMNVIHRDLKPLNILMNCDKLQIKITDFGLSRELYLKLSCDGNTKEIVEKDEVLLTSHVGTQPYIAPEIQGSSYDFKADLYSVGLIAYEIFCPMQSKSEKYKKFDQLKSHSEIDQKFQQEHPSEADLVIQLTQKDPNNRLTAFEALNHKLFQSKNQGMSSHSFELVKHEIEVLKEGINCIRNEVSQYKKKVDSFFVEFSSLKLKTCSSDAMV